MRRFLPGSILARILTLELKARGVSLEPVRMECVAGNVASAFHVKGTASIAPSFLSLQECKATGVCGAATRRRLAGTWSVARAAAAPLGRRRAEVSAVMAFREYRPAAV
jgi:hypothetical protein